MIDAGRTAAVVLAAGSSTRFGSPKALAPLWGRPLLQHVLDTVATIEFAEVVVVLGRDAPSIEAAVVWRTERRIDNPDPVAGLSGSVRIGLQALGDSSQAALIFLGDQPTVRADVARRLLEVSVSPERPIAVPRYGGGGGPNPLLIHRSAWPLALEASADRGLGPMLREHRELVAEVSVTGSNPDVDTPADLEALEAGTPPNDERVAPLIPLASPTNLRDFGGYLTLDGRRVRTGLLYRSAALDRLTDADAGELAQLPIRTVYDLRSSAEREQHPDRVPAGARYVVADVINGMAGPNPAVVMEHMRDTALARRLYGEGRAAAMFLDQYRGFVALKTTREAFGAMYRDLAEADSRPALVHCTGGKDRTGWASAALLLLLGVPEDAVLADFMASNSYLASWFRPFLEQFARQGGDSELLAQFSWVRPSYLEASLRQLRDSYGTIERYFTDGLGVGPAAIQALRLAFLE
jgi:protein-tyrosine phosphatase